MRDATGAQVLVRFYEVESVKMYSVELNQVVFMKSVWSAKEDHGDLCVAVVL